MTKPVTSSNTAATMPPCARPGAPSNARRSTTRATTSASTAPSSASMSALVGLAVPATARSLKPEPALPIGKVPDATDDRISASRSRRGAASSAAAMACAWRSISASCSSSASCLANAWFRSRSAAAAAARTASVDMAGRGRQAIFLPPPGTQRLPRRAGPGTGGGDGDRSIREVLPRRGSAVRSPRNPHPVRRDRIWAALVAAALAASVPAIGTMQPASAAIAKFPAASWNRGIGPTHLSSPVIADVNRDGRPDIVTADLSGWLHVLDGRNGRDLRGWPRPVQVNPGQTVAVESSPTVADLGRNGHEVIILGAGSIDVPGQQGGVVAFNANGSVKWRIKTMTVAGESGVVGTPAGGGGNGGHSPHVVFGSYDHRIYAVNRNGRALTGFPINSLDTIWDSPALFDVGNIGRMDIFVGGDASAGGPCGNWSWAGVLRRIRVASFGPRVIW